MFWIEKLWNKNKEKNDYDVICEAEAYITLRADVRLDFGKLVRLQPTGELTKALMEEHFANMSSEKSVVKAVKKCLNRRAKDFTNALKDELASNPELYYYAEKTDANTEERPSVSSEEVLPVPEAPKDIQNDEGKDGEKSTSV